MSSRYFHKSLTFAAAAVMMAGMVGTVSAETTWQKNHPRRTQTHHRPGNQHRRTGNDAKHGTVSHGHAAGVHDFHKAPK